jgi:hypothetical protein
MSYYQNDTRPSPQKPEIRIDENGEEYQYYFHEGFIIKEYKPGRPNKLPNKITINPETQEVYEEVWLDSQYRLHREDGPARIRYNLSPPYADRADYWQLHGKSNKWIPEQITYDPGHLAHVKYPTDYVKTEWTDEAHLERIYKEGGLVDLRTYLGVINSMGDFVSHLPLFMASTGFPSDDTLALLKS